MVNAQDFADDKIFI